MMRSSLLAVAVALTLLAGSAAGDDHASTRLSRVGATIEKLEGQTLSVKTSAGKELSLILPPDVRVMRSRLATIADVKAGQFIGCTAVEGPDGKLRAKEIHILPEAMRGVGEGHYQWDDTPKTTMTNGNIEDVAGVTDGHVIAVSYNGGQSVIEIRPEVTVTTIEVVGRDLLKPGTKVNLFAHKNPDGSLTPQYVGTVP